MSNGTISSRLFIRWLPDEGSEPTSTIVITSPQQRYVDLRILQSAGAERSPGSLQCACASSAHDAEICTLERLDWAIAGVSSSSTRDDGNGAQIAHSTFYHWIDSRTTDPESATDEGDMFPQVDGTTLEKGSMVNPATGRETEYEELWLDIDPTSAAAPEGVRCVVLKLDEGEGDRGMAIRLGPYCQAFRRSGDELSLERWEWMEQTGWKRVVKMGTLGLPCSEMVEDGAKFWLDDDIDSGDGPWIVVEVIEG